MTVQSCFITVTDTEKNQDIFNSLVKYQVAQIKEQFRNYERIMYCSNLENVNE